MIQVLSRLLRSKNAEDLQAANRLIKNLVKQVSVPYVVVIPNCIYVKFLLIYQTDIALL